jgi:hypothetical protein
MMLNKLEEGSENEKTNGTRHPARNSLRDRFKVLRMREEAGIISLGEDDEAGPAIAGLVGRTTGLGLSIASTTTMDDQAISPASPNPAIINPSLAPGTASGVSAGPSASLEVDWDLWQSVVYEGPAAVARTSPEELNRAIATGIPSAIRGVVWQVLAQSKNEDLETVYRELVNRGTEHEKDRSSGTSSTGVSSHAWSGKDKDTASSASSIHSEGSSPAAATRSHSPPEKDSESVAKLKAATLAERKKQAKEDAAALHKLEKAIKRDLGSRTSFSKFASSAGLQDGLFGVCKAYALFDEGVGYAQGMNFLAMPLLFNVSVQ